MSARGANNLCITFFGFGTNSGPFGLLLHAPEIIFFTPIRATTTPKVEEDSKRFAREALKLIDHDSNVFARDRKAKHPS
jgi:hypothetical protein